MPCQTCKSQRILHISAKCSDCFGANINEPVQRCYDGYVPREIGIGGGDCVSFRYCLDCGQVQGKFPIPTAAVEEDSEWLTAEDVCDHLEKRHKTPRGKTFCTECDSVLEYNPRDYQWYKVDGR